MAWDGEQHSAATEAYVAAVARLVQVYRDGGRSDLQLIDDVLREEQPPEDQIGRVQSLVAYLLMHPPS